MGLDFAELILEVEEAFDISLADDEMMKIVTVGQLYDAIMHALPCPERKFCLSAVTFHRLHQSLLTVTERKRGEVRPSTRLDILIPSRQRKVAWKKIQQLSGLRLPPLRMPTWAVPVILVCVVLVVVVSVFSLDWPLSYVSIVPGFVVFFLSYWIVDAFFGTGLPSHFQTVGGLTKAVLAKNFVKLSGEIANYDWNDVWESVRILIADQLGVEIEKVRKETRFVADLGMG